MRFYPQVLLWTYVLLPAICLLLTPTFIMALAKAQQHRAKVMANALTARGRAAAAIVRNHQRRYVPNTRYSNSFGQNKPFRFRTKRDLDTSVLQDQPFEIIEPTNKNIQLDPSVVQKLSPNKPNVDVKTQNQRRLIDTNVGLELQNAGWNTNSANEAEKPPPKFNPELHRIKDPLFEERQSHWDQQEESLSQLQNMWNMNNFGTQDHKIMRSTNLDFKSENPKVIVGHQHLRGNRNHKNDGKSDYYSGAFSGRNVFDDVLESRPSSTIPDANFASFIEERSANPEPTFKKKKKKFGKNQELYPYTQYNYNSYSPQASFLNFDYNPYSRNAQSEDMPVSVITDNMGEEIIGEEFPQDIESNLGDPEPSFKKKKKFGKEHVPYAYPQHFYNSYHPQYSYATAYNYPYAKSTEVEDMTPRALVKMEDDMAPKLANPEPTFKKKKKFSKKQEPYPYPQNYYNSYNPEYSHASSYYYPYAKSVEFQDIPETEPIKTDDMRRVTTEEKFLPDVKPRIADPEPTFKKKKKFNKKEELHSAPQNYYNSYYPQYSYTNSHYYPYARGTELEDMPQVEIIEPINISDDKIGELASSAEVEGMPQNVPLETTLVQDMEPKLASPEPTFNKIKNNKFGQEAKMEPGYYYSQNYNSPYFGRSSEAEDMLRNMQEQQFMLGELVSPRFANPEPTFKKKKKKIEKMPPSFYYPTHQYNSYYPVNSYSNSHFYPYGRTAETEGITQHKPIETEADDKVFGERSILKMEEKEANPKPHRIHKKIETKQGNGENFFYSSNFYERNNGNKAMETEKKQALSNQEIRNQQKQQDTQQATPKVNSENVGTPLKNIGSHGETEDVGCEQDDQLFDSKTDSKKFDPYDYYQRTVHEISEESKKLVEKTKKLLQPIQEAQQEQKPLTPIKEVPQEPEVAYVNLDEISDNNYNYNEQPRSEAVFQSQDGMDDLTSLKRKSADPNADPHVHSHGFTHTHGHFHSHTHGHAHQKNIGKHHGLHSVPPGIPQVPTVPTHHHGGFSQSNVNAHTFNHDGIQNSFAHANTKSFGNGFNPNGDIAQAETQTFGNGGFGQSIASTSSIKQNGGQFFVPGSSIAQAGAHSFQNGGYGQSTAQATAQAGLTGHHNSQNFFNGFHDSQHLGFNNNNPNQLASNFAGAQVVGQTHEEQSFVMPHLDEIPVQDLLIDMESGMQRYHRSPGEFQDGLSIVDASLYKNKAETLSNDDQDAQNTMAFVTNIVDSSLKAGESNTKIGPHFGTPLHTSFDSESANDFQDAFRGLALASNIVDASLDKNDFLDKNNNEQVFDNSKDFQNPMSFVKNIVDSSLTAGELSTQNNNNFRIPSQTHFTLEPTRQLTLNGITSLTDLVSRGLRNKRQTNDTNLTIPYDTNNIAEKKSAFETSTNLSRDTILMKQSPEQAQDETKRNTDSNSNEKKKNQEDDVDIKDEAAIVPRINQDLIQKQDFLSDLKITNLQGTKNEIYASTTPTSSEASMSKSTVQGEKVVGMIDPDLLIPTPEIITLEPWSSNWDYKNNRVIYNTNNEKTVPSEVDFESLRENKTEKNVNEDNFKSLQPNTTSGKLSKTLQKNYKEPLSVNTGLESIKELLLTNPVTENINFYAVTHHDIVGDKDNQNMRLLKEQGTKSIKSPSRNAPVQLVENNLNIDNTTQENDNEATKHDSFLEMEHLKDEGIVALNARKNNGDIDHVHHKGDILGLHSSRQPPQSVLDPINNSKINDNLSSEDKLEMSLLAKKNKTFSNVGILKENTSSGTPGEILPYLFYADEAKKKVSDITSDEIQDLQFDVPESHKSTSPPNLRNNFGTISSELSVQNNENSTAEQESNTEKSENNDNIILGMSLHNNNDKKVKHKYPNAFDDATSHVPTVTPNSTREHFQNDSIQKIIFSTSENPFASIEAEMGVLTEDEKEEFIRQEIDLISEFIEETIKNGQFKETNLNDQNERKNISTNGNKESIVESPNIFQTYLRRDSDHVEYSRQARSAIPTDTILTAALNQQKQKVENIKNEATDEDNDLLLISFIGDSVIRDLESRHHKTDSINETSPVNETNKDIEIDQMNPHSHINLDNLDHKTESTNKLAVTNNTKKITESFSHKTKREINGLRSSRAPLTQLIYDPMTKLNVEKTFQNLGSIARHTFENPRAPMYHVRNMLGNAKNSVMSAAKVAPNNFLIPSQYEIAKISKDEELNGEQVGAINQNMLLSRGGFGDIETEENHKESANDFKKGSFGFEDTVQKLGGIVRESVQSGKDALTHVNDLATDAKQVVQTSKQATPRLILPRPRPLLAPIASYQSLSGTPLLGTPQIPKHLPNTSPLGKKTVLASRGAYQPLYGTYLLGAHQLNTPLPNIAPSGRKAILITPKIFDIQQNIVGSAPEQPDNFVGMGHILDAAGISQPNQPEYELQKIIFEPFSNKKQYTMPEVMPYSTDKTLIKESLKMKTNETNNILGSKHLNNEASVNLQEGQKAVTENLKNFMLRMHNEMQEIVRSQYEERKRKRKQRTKKQKNSSDHKNKKDLKSLNEPKMHTVVPTKQQNRKLTPRIPEDTNIYSNVRKNYDENVEITLPPELSSFFEKPQSGINQKLIFGREVEDEMETPIVHSISQKMQTNDNFKKANQEIFSPEAMRTKVFSQQVQNQENMFKDFQNSNNNDNDEQVQLFLPDNLMKPFMGQPSNTLLHDYMLENGDEDIPLQIGSETNNLDTLFSTVKPILPFNSVTSLTPKLMSSRNSMSSLGLDVPKMKPLLAPAAITKPEIVGAVGNRNINKEDVSKSLEITEKTKEFVELLSEPEIDDEVSEKTQNSLNNSLDFTSKDQVLEYPILVPNKTKISSSFQNTFKHNLTESSTDYSSGFNANKNIQTTEHLSSLSDDNAQETKTANLLGNMKQKPSSLTFGKNPPTAAHMPDQEDLGYVLGAINPMMFERYFNERLKIQDTGSKSTHDKFLKHGIIKDDNKHREVDDIENSNLSPDIHLNKVSHQFEKENINQPLVKIDENKKESGKIEETHSNIDSNQKDKDADQPEEMTQRTNNQPEQVNEIGDDARESNSTSRTSMTVLDTYKKPFMGYVTKDKLHEFLNKYNNNLSDGSEIQHEKEYGEKYVDPSKTVVFPMFDEDDDYYVS